MEKPNREEKKYWLPMVIDKIKGTKEIPFDHISYERDLEKYIDYLEQLVKNNGVLDDVIVNDEGCPICYKKTIEEIDNCGICGDE